MFVILFSLWNSILPLAQRQIIVVILLHQQLNFNVNLHGQIVADHFWLSTHFKPTQNIMINKMNYMMDCILLFIFLWLPFLHHSEEIFGGEIVLFYSLCAVYLFKETKHGFIYFLLQVMWNVISLFSIQSYDVFFCFYI